VEVTCTIMLADEDGLPGTREEVADAVLAACGGDPAKDVVHLSLGVPTTTRGTPPDELGGVR
jgi:hypothetical protein